VGQDRRQILRRDRLDPWVLALKVEREPKQQARQSVPGVYACNAW
jgi:hypothetical protein